MSASKRSEHSRTSSGLDRCEECAAHESKEVHRDALGVTQSRIAPLERELQILRDTGGKNWERKRACSVGAPAAGRLKHPGSPG
jgi:hypothetical protein